MPLFGWISLAAAAVAVLGGLYFYRVIGKRDLVRPPDEKTYGVGLKKALLIYQPSNSGRNVTTTRALAQALAKAGYTVTVNHPSRKLEYDPMAYDLLVFGGSAYLGSVARPLTEYVSRLKYTGKKVLLYVVGDLEKTIELATLRLCVPAGNHIRSIKVRAAEGAKLAAFATLHES